MPRPRKHIPTYRHHKQSGQAIVTVWSGGRRRDLLLGKYGTPESRQEYERVLAQLRTQSGASILTPAADLTVNELILAYLDAEKAHDTTAKQSRSGTNPRYALKKLKSLYGPSPAAEIGPRALQVLREAWVTDGLSRKVVNARVGAVRRVVRWAVAQELLPVEVYQRLQAVEGLRAGQTAAPDRAPVRPAVLADVEKAIPHMPPLVGAVVLLQLHSAARAGELVELRVRDIDRTNPDVWTFTPTAHKGTWKGKGRVIYFGARCREVLEPLILKADDTEAYLFSPTRSEAERNAARSDKRATPKWESHMERNERKRVGAARMRAPGSHYSTGTVRQAIERACDAAGVPRFTPHRLRHLAATRARAELGVDVARALCGHTLASVTEIYSRDVDKQLAMQAVKKFG